MSKMSNKLLFVFVALLFCFTACEREGLDRDAIYTALDFRPISNVRGEAGYGNAVLKWDLPDSAFVLFCVEVSWEAEGKELQKRILPRHDDSLVISDLDSLEYVFRFVSRGVKGEQSEPLEVKLKVTDWELEPPAEISGFKYKVVENTIVMNWVNPQHRTFDHVVFELYKDGILERAEEVDTTAYTIENLLNSTAYQVRYYSMNTKGVRSVERTVDCVTADKAPDIPEVIHDKSRIDYAYCADITWTPTEGMDSLQIVFKDLDGKEREYCFGGADDNGEGKGYLSMLSGGTTDLEVSVRGTNGAWSRSVKQKIVTRLGVEGHMFRDKNYSPTITNPAGQTNKLLECIVLQLGLAGGGNGPIRYDKMADPKFTFIEVRLKPIYIDELENAVRLKQIRVSGNGMPEAGSVDHCPPLQHFLDLADRLPFFNELIVNKKYKLFKELKKAFKDHPKVKFTEL